MTITPVPGSVIRENSKYEEAKEMLSFAITFIVLLLCGVPIAFVLGMTALPYLILLGDIPLTIIPQKMFTGLDSFLMVSLPFFLLASSIMNSGGITERIVAFVNITLGHIRGGLAHVNVAVSMVFAGLAGMAMADTAAVGGLLIPAMVKDGYDEDFACAVTASSSTIGPIIPPSFLFILYSLVAGGVSVAALFLAGVIPGLLLGLFNMALVVAYSIKRGYPAKKRASVLKMLKSFLRVIPALFVPVIMIGGIVSGIFTATEAAAIAVVAALIVSIFFYREMKISNLFRLVVDTGIVVGSLAFILSGATVFAWILTAEQVPQLAIKYLTAISSNPYVILFLMNVFLLLIGTFMDPTPSMLILAPILLPIAVSLGMSPVHFGVVITLNLVIGLTTPPVGGCLFIASSISRISVERIGRAIWPFLLVNILVLLLITYVPWLTGIIPSLFWD